MINSKLVFFPILLVGGFSINEFYFNVTSYPNHTLTNDTTILNARLADTVTDDFLWRWPDHIAISMRFQIQDSTAHKKQIDIIFFAADRSRKKFFQINRIYNIYASRHKERYAFGPVSYFADSNYVELVCDSIFLQK